MPTYEYHCNSCGKTFTQQTSVSEHDSGKPTCPKCHLAFDAKRWAHHNRRTHINGRYTITPVYTCPRCGETVQAADN